ncbi:hypothetical protein Droror1_Dr00016688 [Drosera rotundifolia]
MGTLKLRLKKGWRTVMPLPIRGKSATRFSLFSKIKSSSIGPGSTPVYLNVYDVISMNKYLNWAGLGVFHSGVEVHGVEYAFGARDDPTSGISEVEPRQYPGCKFRKSVLIGMTRLDPKQAREFMEQLAGSYSGDSYHLINKNCNHFCEDVCHKLTGKKIPMWVNRLAKLGSACSCVLPESLTITRVQDNGNLIDLGTEKSHLRSSFTSLSSISMRHRQLSASSKFLRSPLKSCLPLYEWGGLKSRSLKER